MPMNRLGAGYSYIASTPRGPQQVDSPLREAHPQHNLLPHRTKPGAVLNLMCSHQRYKRGPQHDALHLIEKTLPPTFPSVLLRFVRAKQGRLLIGQYRGPQTNQSKPLVRTCAER